MRNKLLLIFLFLPCFNVLSQENNLHQEKFDFSAIEIDTTNKRIICLGESMHRIETFNHYKVEFIDYLHKKYNYNLISFESGMLEVANAFFKINSDTAMLCNSLYGIWRTTSVLNLFNYATKSKSEEKQMVLTGFDLKGNSTYTTSMWLKNIFEQINPEYAELIYSTDTSLMNHYKRYDSGNKLKFIDKDVSDKYILFYQGLLDSLKFYETKILHSSILSDFQYKIVKQSIVNRNYLTVFLSSKNMHTAFEYRNIAMAKNMTWLLTELYPDKNVVFWGHDNHISKEKTNESKRMRYSSSIGLLPDSLKSKVMAISFDFWENAPKSFRKDSKLIAGNVFLMNNKKNNKIFDYIFYFRKTESIDKFRIKCR